VAMRHDGSAVDLAPRRSARVHAWAHVCWLRRDPAARGSGLRDRIERTQRKRDPGLESAE
jgi:hypothetical protein